MQQRKRGLRWADIHHHRDQHRHALAAVLVLCGVVLIINAWLVSQNVVNF